MGSTPTALDLVCWALEDLAILRDNFQALPYARLGPEQLYEQFVSVRELAWEPAEMIDFEPRFGDPFPKDDFDRLFEERRRRNTDICSPPQWFLDPSFPPQTRLREAEELVRYLNHWLGQPDYAEYGHLAGHGDWLTA